jgi:acyl-CoA thioester hydrolase
MEPIIFETNHRVKFREIDAYGHMNMSHYLTYYTDHRFEGMRRFVDLDLKRLEALPFAFHTRNISIDYIRPLFADQEFVIRSQVTEWNKVSLVVEFEMKNASDEIISKAKMKVGCIDKQSSKPGAWPTGFAEQFQRKS